MKKTKLRVMATALSAIAMVSALGVVSASAAETTQENMDTNNAQVAMIPDESNPRYMKEYLEKICAYSKAKGFLEEKGISSRIIDKVVKMPEFLSTPDIDNDYVIAGVISPQDEMDYLLMSNAYDLAKEHLTELGYSTKIINAVLVVPVHPADVKHDEVWA